MNKKQRIAFLLFIAFFFFCNYNTHELRAKLSYYTLCRLDINLPLWSGQGGGKLNFQNPDNSGQDTLSTIAFGSCNQQNKAQPMWEHIIKNKPDLWIWLGDNIYADTEDMNEMKRQYAQQLQHKDYQHLLASCPIIGTWDDHDYGVNNGGKAYPRKEESKQLMLDFLGVPKTAEVRTRPGAYQTYVYGQSPRQVKIILLDTRSFKDDIGDKKTGYRLRPEAEILGKAQWDWLEMELKNNTADLTIIANGTQVLPMEHKYEKWANFPEERERLFKLLGKSTTKNIFLLSGDRHFGEISCLHVPGGKAIHEVTSSGLTHSYKTRRNESNQFRMGNSTVERNFGLMRIEWDAPVPHVHLQLRGLGNVLREDIEVELN